MLGVFSLVRCAAHTHTRIKGEKPNYKKRYFGCQNKTIDVLSRCKIVSLNNILTSKSLATKLLWILLMAKIM